MGWLSGAIRNRTVGLLSTVSLNKVPNSLFRHPRGGGGPEVFRPRLDSRLRGNDGQRAVFRILYCVALY
jgi:hypothetical protein